MSGECQGCGWDAWTAANPRAGHRHRDDLDGDRLGCCAHTCAVTISGETRDQLEDLLGGIADNRATDIGEWNHLRREAAAILPELRRASPK